ncbi:MAG: hypothetical protein Q4G03_12070, partial [Planctomycetia bacterium]|nr:hypothetical protein [Planctomycetia bacterium]
MKFDYELPKPVGFGKIKKDIKSLRDANYSALLSVSPLAYYTLFCKIEKVCNLGCKLPKPTVFGNHVHGVHSSS